MDEAREARLFAVGLGYGEFSLNGTVVTEDVLEPAQTDYGRTVLYRSYDVTNLLRRGENTLVAELGRGFYAARGANPWAWQLSPWHREPVVIAQLEYVDGAGRRIVVATDDSRETADSAMVGDILYTGETIVRTGKQWVRAAEVTPPGGKLIPARAAPVRRAEVLPAVFARALG
ncbi:alpha-L-rhamnosidase N-terminal domain-containing protein [Amycolatopsis sp. FDAARGOS 1241]|uniref:alpha-L-rhamnosidase N-terminal domain-containing protein n=1 Tax=Amycolatopsis sp. FDAARGOS 1241 TaxID=2778070 RepID=UPI0019501C70|nr:alpha-L-rhamnosidase N-terminal domain-containing protein [Amycolatopsis sp. FDAARGOS 1241]QRP48475.1 alpha-L-rhamnosidase N-terminal domain-containing protein [Amycolatopsis sp. FDAARGOS 1241]